MLSYNQKAETYAAQEQRTEYFTLALQRSEVLVKVLGELENKLAPILVLTPETPPNRNYSEVRDAPEIRTQREEQIYQVAEALENCYLRIQNIIMRARP